MNATPEVKRYLAKIGRQGGLVSKRRLSLATARAMVRLREVKKAYRQFHARCFWSASLQRRIQTEEDIQEILQGLREHGGPEGWQVARKLEILSLPPCR
jgi:hypothetical protein